MFFSMIFVIAMICSCVTAAGKETERTLEPITIVTAEVFYAARVPPVSLELMTSTDEPEPELLYDVPLSDELQRFVRAECEERGVPFDIAIALMGRESSYQADAKSATDDYGIMQINSCNHNWLAEELGLTDIMDPRQNITAGVYILGEAFEKYEDPNQALMVYNMGDAGMRRAWEAGNRSTKYSRSIIEAASLLKAR